MASYRPEPIDHERLREGWVRVRDPSSGLVHFWNPGTSARSFNAPLESQHAVSSGRPSWSSSLQPAMRGMARALAAKVVQQGEDMKRARSISVAHVEDNGARKSVRWANDLAKLRLFDERRPALAAHAAVRRLSGHRYKASSVVPHTAVLQLQHEQAFDRPEADRM